MKAVLKDFINQCETVFVNMAIYRLLKALKVPTSKNTLYNLLLENFHNPFQECNFVQPHVFEQVIQTGLDFGSYKLVSGNIALVED